MRTPILVGLVFSLAGCHRYVVTPGVPGVPLAPTRAAYSFVDAEQERAPSIVPNDVLLDHATLRVEATRTCATVSLRQSVSWDLPTELLVVRCTNGEERAEGEVVRQDQQVWRDYPFTGAAPQLSVRGRGVALTVPVGEPEERVFRVAERTFEACCPLTAGELFKLSLAGRLGKPGLSASVRTDFMWKLQLAVSSQ